MSAAALQHYRRLVRDLLRARELGGELSQDEEAERADELDIQWQQMTEEERRAVEDEVAGVPSR